MVHPPRPLTLLAQHLHAERGSQLAPPRRLQEGATQRGGRRLPRHRGAYAPKQPRRLRTHGQVGAVGRGGGGERAALAAAHARSLGHAALHGVAACAYCAFSYSLFCRRVCAHVLSASWVTSSSLLALPACNAVPPTQGRAPHLARRRIVHITCCHSASAWRPACYRLGRLRDGVLHNRWACWHQSTAEGQVGGRTVPAAALARAAARAAPACRQTRAAHDALPPPRPPPPPWKAARSPARPAQRSAAPRQPRRPRWCRPRPG